MEADCSKSAERHTHTHTDSSRARQTGTRDALYEYTKRDVMRNVIVEQEKGRKKKKKPEQSQSVNEREEETQTEMGWGEVSWSADRSPEVVIYSIVSISQQQLQPSFFISLHSLRTEIYFCPSEPNRHSR